jgi:carboxymethylenebutenolidase
VSRIPGDVQVELISRTIGSEGIVDEMLISFTHDIEMPWMLPTIPATGRKVAILAVVIIAFRDGKVATEHVYWDQASVLAQIGLLPASRLPVLADGQARALLDSSVALNTLLAAPEVGEGWAR